MDVIQSTSTGHNGLSQDKRTRYSLSLKKKHVPIKNEENIEKLQGKRTRYSLSLKKKYVPIKNEENIEKDESYAINNEICDETAVKAVNNNINVHEAETEYLGSDVQNSICNGSKVVNINTLENVDLDWSKSSNCTQQVAINKVNNAIDVSNNNTDPDFLENQSSDDCVRVSEIYSLVSVSSASDTENVLTNDSLDETIIYEKPSYSVSIALSNCKNVNVTAKNVNIKRMHVSHDENDTNIDCEIIENSQESENYKSIPSPPKKQAVSLSMEIKNKDLSTSEDYQSKVLILNTNSIEKLSHVIIQPPHYKSIRRKIKGQGKLLNNRNKSVIRSGKNKNASVDGGKLRQNKIESYFKVSKVTSKTKLASKTGSSENRENVLVHNDMNKAVRADTARSDGIGRLSRKNLQKEDNVLPRSSKILHRESMAHTRQDIKTSNSDAPPLPSPRSKNESMGSCSPRRRVDSLHFNLPCKTKVKPIPRDIPYYKIVAGTTFAVDAFCYGEIPGVQNYFLTHFHSDHYTGLRKNFNKVLYCSKITADLCIARLGVNLNCIHIIHVDETVKVDDVLVTAIDANHCPGALMLLFTLPNGKTLLHTGDFRATPAMESHPAFWNNDIHTIYLDTTYCNPHYDFPTQEQSVEMALQILRQKKKSLEDDGKKFASVLIVCGTYTIGKEKFFLGLANQAGCRVWACPEKDKILQLVEGRSFSHSTPQSCQLHVVPMRDLTHEKLRCYLESLNGAFSEIVAFKPSGWENKKSTAVTKDNITIHGVPYSEHSSFSEMIRFVKYLKPKQVVPTVDISGGVKAVQKYFPCPLVYKEDVLYQSKLTDFFNVQNRQQISAAS